MRSVFKWLCHTEDLMIDDVRDDVSVEPQGIRIFLFIRFILITRITLITLITRIIQGMVIHIKCS